MWLSAASIPIDPELAKVKYDLGYTICEVYHIN